MFLIIAGICGTVTLTDMQSVVPNEPVKGVAESRIGHRVAAKTGGKVID